MMPKTEAPCQTLNGPQFSPTAPDHYDRTRNDEEIRGRLPGSHIGLRVSRARLHTRRDVRARVGLRLRQVRTSRVHIGVCARVRRGRRDLLECLRGPGSSHFCGPSGLLLVNRCYLPPQKKLALRAKILSPRAESESVRSEKPARR